MIKVNIKKNVQLKILLIQHGGSYTPLSSLTLTLAWCILQMKARTSCTWQTEMICSEKKIILIPKIKDWLKLKQKKRGISWTRGFIFRMKRPLRWKMQALSMLYTYWDTCISQLVLMLIQYTIFMMNKGLIPCQWSKMLVHCIYTSYCVHYLCLGFRERARNVKICRCV